MVNDHCTDCQERAMNLKPILTSKICPAAPEPLVSWTLPNQAQRDYINCNSHSVAGNIFEYESHGFGEGLMLNFKLFEGRTLVPYSSRQSMDLRRVDPSSDLTAGKNLLGRLLQALKIQLAAAKHRNRSNFCKAVFTW